MRIKITLFVLILFGVLTSEEAVAQRVAEDGYAVVDCSGMAKGVVKTPQELIDSKTEGGRVRRHRQNNQEGTHIDGTNGTITLYVNHKVSRKFAVAPNNCTISSTSPNANSMTWAEASGWHTDANSEITGESTSAETGCVVYTHKADKSDKGSWRLPTQRELMIIYAHKGQLEKTKDTSLDNTEFSSFGNSNYWSSTENSSNYSWIVGFYSGYVSFSNKTGSLYVRCVRDL